MILEPTRCPANCALGDRRRADVSGGTNTSHTIVVGALAPLLDAVPADGSAAALRVPRPRGQRTRQGHRRPPDGARSATSASSTSCGPTRCCSGRYATCGRSTPKRGRCSRGCAPSPATPSSAPAAGNHGHAPGDTLASADLADAVGEHFPAELQRPARWPRSAGTRSRRGSRPATSRTRSEPTKVRTRAMCRPANVAYALLLGHLEGRARPGAVRHALGAECSISPRRT